MTKTVICYKRREPIVYNKGTQYERSCDTFLAYYTYKSVIDAQAEVDAINKNKPVNDPRGLPIDWTVI